jgi:sugar (pentulose or hexulose) kinase
MTHLGETYSPDAQAHALYEELYNDIYLKMYAKLQPFYKKMRQLGQKD